MRINYINEFLFSLKEGFVSHFNYPLNTYCYWQKVPQLYVEKRDLASGR